MRKAASTHVALSFVILTASLLVVAPAWATEWKVCNSSPEDITVAIVYDLGDARQYISKGWWRVLANGGCRVVYNGNLPRTGVFLRGEGAQGSVWAGDNLFCTSQARFEIPHANVNERTCRARGQDMKAFGLHTITSDNFTTTLRSNTQSRSHRID
jgi:uncharacterized membrane protein